MKERLRIWLPTIRPLIVALLLFDLRAIRSMLLLARLQQEFGLVEIQERVRDQS